MRLLNKYFHTGLYLGVSVLLTACGGEGNEGGGPVAGVLAPGGSSSSGPVTSALSFSLQTAYKTRVANGSTTNYTITGSCNGSASLVQTAPAAATFNGASGLSVTNTKTVNYTNCSPATNTVTSLGYYDSNYNPLGSSTAGTEYGVFLTAPSPLPTSAKVGNTAVLGTQTIYTDSTKATLIGTQEESYAIEPDTAATAIGNFITKRYNASNQLLWTTQNRLRIDAAGAFTPVSISTQYSTTSTNNEVWTAK